jgi:hypothetical protein
MLSKSNPGGLEPSRKNLASSSEPSNSLWVNAHLSLVEANATKWFEDLGPKTIPEVFPSQLEAQKGVHDYSPYFSGQVDGSIIPSMEIDLDKLGEPEVLEDTELGKAVIAELNSRGVNFRFSDSIPISHFQSIVLEVGDELLGQWGSEMGTPFHQHFKVFKNEAGEETGFWFVQLLASPLPLSDANEFEVELDGRPQIVQIPDDQLAQGLFCYGDISAKIHLPILLKNIAFLGETPLPNSQLMSFSRDLAFKDIPASSRPLPSYSILKDKAFLSFAPGDEETGEPDSYKGQIVPETVVFGWRFGTESLDHISSFISTIVDGCTLAVSTVEDGYKNFRSEDSKIDYDSSLSNPCRHYLDYVWGGSRLARPQWIPVTSFGQIISTCEKSLQIGRALLNAGEFDDAWTEFRKVMSDGVGWYLASAINTLEYRWYIPNLVQEPSAISDSEYYLKQAISLNVLNESTNALINLGLAKMMVGDYEDAQKILYGALDRPDKFGKAEIQYYRSLIYAKQGDRSGQMLLSGVVKELGGFLAPAYIEEAMKLGVTTAPDFESTRPQNCGACGTQFESEATNFCGSCGVGREEVSIPGDKSIGQGSIRVGFVLEIHSINEELDQPMALDSLTSFKESSLIESGYGNIWRAPAGLKTLVEEQEFSSEVWTDPTSISSYLEALAGGVNGDLLTFSFDAEPKPMDLNVSSWDVVRKRLKTSLAHDFLLEEHRVDFEASGQSFYIEEIEIEGSKTLSVENLEASLESLRSATNPAIQANEFLEFFSAEVIRPKQLPPFISGHIWAQLLSGCDWDLASQILSGKAITTFDSGSFNWTAPAQDLQSYVGGYSVAWYRNVRRSLNFNPWPWQNDSLDEKQFPDKSCLYRRQVEQLLGGREPAAQEKVVAFAALYLLIDHEDSEDDDAPNTSDRVRNLIENHLSESLQEFIDTNRELVKDCFFAFQEFLSDLGDGEEWLPEWSGSEGVLAGVPHSWSADGATAIEFTPELVDAVQKLWPEFLSLASQPSDE